ncbi:unnamed protein product [Rhodiola kirilowii]
MTTWYLYECESLGLKKRERVNELLRYHRERQQWEKKLNIKSHQSDRKKKIEDPLVYTVRESRTCHHLPTSSREVRGRPNSVTIGSVRGKWRNQNET